MSRRNRFIDCLKGISILAIIIYHFSPNLLRGGYIGVPLFFIISGYLIAKNTKKRDYMGQFSIKDYYLARINRIYPVLFLFVGLVSFIAYFYAPRLLNQAGGEYLSIFLGYNNFWQMGQNLSYFDRIANASAFTHLWFLAIQLQFYFTWPVWYKLYSWLKGYWNHADHFFLLLAGVSILSMPIGYLLGIDISVLYYHTFTRIGALLLGVWIGLNEAHIRLKLKEYQAHPYLFYSFIWVIVLNIGFALLLEGQSGFTYNIGLPMITLSQAFLISIGLEKEFNFTYFLKNSVLEWLGTRSYELFLWHYTIFFLFRIMKIDSNILSILFQMILLVTLSELSYRIGNLFAKVLKNGLKPIYLSIINYEWSDKRQLLFNRYVYLFLVFYLAYVGLGLGTIYSIVKPQVKTDLEGQLNENSQLVAEQSLITIQTSSTESSQENQTPDQPETTIQTEQDVTQQPITMIGDSVMLGTFKELKAIFPNSYIDGKESRQAYDIAPLLNQLKADGTLADTVIIALGTNGYFQKATGDEIMEILGPNRTVFWVNVYGQYLEWEKSTNAIINEMVNQYPNLYLIDWASQVKNNPDWLIEDGIHPDIEGRQAYANIIKNAIETVLE